jgi:hypothetical protein
MKLKVSGFGQIYFADVRKFYQVAFVGLELHIKYHASSTSSKPGCTIILVSLWVY